MAFTLDNSWWYNTIIYTGVALALPLAVISYCYWQIYKVAKNSAARSEKRRREQRQLLVSLLTIFAAFVITWTPMGVVLFLAGITSDYTEFIPEEVVIICDLFAHSNSGVNFIIYGFTHRGLRRAYRMWYQMATPCLNSKPDSSSGTISTNEKNGHK
ncbi:B2 bradykinin receptor-like [Convolutriloba macropyga]|uniref:B2 bradykinin receptor-like n=1 Tax=Convolutriloba macropyga TaxID=536237 RepID=UPI003F523141